MRKVFVIAMQDEAEAVRSALGDDDELLLCGIGKVNAAAAAATAICAHRLSGRPLSELEILNVGFAGGLDATMQVGDCYEIAAAAEYDFDLAKLNHTGVGVLNERTEALIPLAVKGVLPTRNLATGDHFRDDDADYALLAQLGCAVRDMEGGAIAHVCEREGVRCRALKCITNVVGNGSMVGQFMDSRRRCMECLKNAVFSWI